MAQCGDKGLGAPVAKRVLIHQPLLAWCPASPLGHVVFLRFFINKNNAFEYRRHEGQTARDPDIRPLQSAAFARPNSGSVKTVCVVGRDRGDQHRCRTLRVTQKASRIGRRLHGADAYKNPACRPVDCNKKATPPVLIGHLRHVFDVAIQPARFTSFEGTVCWPRFLDLRAFPVFVETRVSPVSRERRRRGRVLAIQHKLETL